MWFWYLVEANFFVFTVATLGAIWTFYKALRNLQKEAITMSAALDRITASVTNLVGQTNTIASEVRDLAKKLTDNPAVPDDDTDALNALSDKLDAAVAATRDALDLDTLPVDPAPLEPTEPTDPVDPAPVEPTDPVAQPNTGDNGPPPAQ